MKFWASVNQILDRLILLTLILVFFWPSVHGSSYAQESSDTVLGALIVLVTAKVTRDQMKK